MSNLRELSELKRKIEAAKSKSERAAGVVEQLMRTLKRDWDCSTIEEGQEKLSDLRKKVERMSKDFEKKRVAFEEAWCEHLR